MGIILEKTRHSSINGQQIKSALKISPVIVFSHSANLLGFFCRVECKSIAWTKWCSFDISLVWHYCTFLFLMASFQNISRSGCLRNDIIFQTNEDRTTFWLAISVWPWANCSLNKNISQYVNRNQVWSQNTIKWGIFYFLSVYQRVLRTNTWKAPS